MTERIRSARGAFLLGFGSLLVAGSVALLLVLGRMPGLSALFQDPDFFKRCLVVHVNLSLLVWLSAFVLVMVALLPTGPRSKWLFPIGVYLTLDGVVLMTATAFLPGTKPILSNYIPAIVSPLFDIGVLLFFAGMTICLLDGRILARSKAPIFSPPGAGWFENGHVPEDVTRGIKCAALVYLAAIVTFACSFVATPRILEAKYYYEFLFWGGGHVMQVAYVAAMLSAWLWMVGSLTGRPVLSGKTAGWLFALLILPHLAGPLLTSQGVMTGWYRTGFTRLMQFGIFPVVLVILGACLWRLRSFRLEHGSFKGRWSDPRLLGFTASVALTLTGFLLGSMIRNSNTMIPAHYHASIGGVTVAFMAISYLLLQPLGLALKTPRARRLIPWQLGAFGFGQVVFALGFAWGGLHGLGRKAYASDQFVASLAQGLGLVVMGLGGLIAVAGGLLYLFLMLKAGRPLLGLFSPRFNLNPEKPL